MTQLGLMIVPPQSPPIPVVGSSIETNTLQGSSPVSVCVPPTIFVAPFGLRTPQVHVEFGETVVLPDDWVVVVGAGVVGAGVVVEPDCPLTVMVHL
jgi:hypothetical protein